MAYYDDIDDQEDVNAPAEQKTTGAESSDLATGSGPTSSTTPSAGQSQATTGAGPSSPFVGIQQYIDANKSGTAKLANDVSNDVKNTAVEAQKQITSVNNSAGDGSFNKTVDDNAKGTAYSGPQSFETSDNFKPVSTAVNNLSTLKDNLGNASGQRQILADKQKATSGNVNEGALNLDTALLGSDPNARNTLSNARQSFADIPGSFQRASDAANQRITEARLSTQRRAQQEQAQAAKVAQEKLIAEREAKLKAAQEAQRLADQAARNKALTAQQNARNKKLSAPLKLTTPVAVAPSAKADVNDLIGAGQKPVNVDSAGREVKSSKFTFICTELLHKDLITRKEFKEIHEMQFRSFLRRGRFAAWYMDNGQKLVDLANEQGFDWIIAKEWFFDSVLFWDKQKVREHWYGLACQRLCMAVAPELWDERVMRNSYVDSLIFLPKVLTYEPHRNMIKRALRRKTKVLLGAHYA